MTKAIELSTNRFDEETKAVFVSLFQKVSGEETTTETETTEEVAF